MSFNKKLKEAWQEKELIKSFKKQKSK